MTDSRTRSRTRVASVWAAGVAVGASMLGGAVLSAPPASATCDLSPADDQYINLLAQNDMVHSAEYSDCHEAAEGRWFATQVKSSADPFGKAKALVNMVTNTTPLKADKAEWEVESAIYVYAPEVIPAIRDQATKQNWPVES